MDRSCLLCFMLVCVLGDDALIVTDRSMAVPLLWIVLVCYVSCWYVF